MAVVLLIFSATMFLLIWGGRKLGKAARKAKMKQDLEIYEEIKREKEIKQ